VFETVMKLVVATAGQVSLHWNYAGNPFTNVIGAVLTGGTVVNQALAEALGSAIKAGLGSSGLGARLHPGTSLEEVGIRDLRTADNAEFRDSGAPVAGTGTGDGLPRQIAMCFTIRTAKAGASYRGRIYLGGFTELDNDVNGGILPTGSDPAGLFLAAISDALDANGMQWGVISRPQEKRRVVTYEPVTKAGFITPMSAIQLRNALWDTQRRRISPGGVESLLTRKTFVTKD